MPKKVMTEKQKDVYDYMFKFFHEEFAMPTMQQIAAKFKFKSPTASAEHVKAICRKGFLEKRKLGVSDKHRYSFTGYEIKLVKKEQDNGI